MQQLQSQQAEMEKDDRARLGHHEHQQQRQQHQLHVGDLRPRRQQKVQLHRHVLCTDWSQQRPLSSPRLPVAVVAIFVLLAVLGVRADAPEKEVLLTIKRDFKAQGMWNPLPSWMEETDPCENEWSGVTCDDLLRITQLNLQLSNLRGSIPYAIGQLKDLQELILSTNYLTGRIPEAIGSLTNLSKLALDNNRLQGQLPNFFGFMGQLQHLQLSHNNFTGKLPRNLGFLKKLTFLDMSQNALVGSIPPQLSALSQLQTLVAYSNNLTGALPDWIGGWESITTLDLHENLLEGSIPELWANADSLVEIILDNNRLTGTLPNGLGALPNLNKLLVSRNELEGQFPNSYSLLDNLELLDLSHNHGINGTIPDYFGSLSSLKSLNLEDCDLSGVLPMSIGQAVQLVELFLGKNRLQGPIPEALSVLADLTRLTLDHNDLTGDFPSWICELSELQVLQVDNNRLTGQVPQCLLSLRNIKSIDITGNYMSGVVPPNPQPSLTFLVNGNCFSNRAGQRSTCDPSQPKAPEPASFDSSPPPPPSSSPDTPPPSPEPETPSTPPDEESPPSSEAPQGDTSSPPPPSTQTMATTEPSSGESNGGVSWTYLFLIFLVIFFFFFVGTVFMMSNPESMPTPFSSPNRSDKLAVMEYSLAKIKRATRNFTSVYGRGSFGTVYLAEDLRKDQVDPRAIIKRAHDPSKMGEFLFKCKVEVLARARHRYLVNLIGYCVGKGERILIYEYLPNGTLFDRLHRPELEPLPWETRVKIAVNVACALEYLHHGVTPPLVHRAVTSSNILLAADMSAKLSDYGIARGTGGSAGAYDDTPARRRKSRASPSRDSSGGSPSDAASANAAAGGAAASNGPSASPTRSEAGSERETLQPAAALEKVDVYGFGVVLLELITGQKAMKEVHITSVAAPFLEDPQMMPLMVDPQLGGYFNHSELVELGTIARDCVHDDPSQRPTMREVLQAMEERLRLDTALFDNIDHDEVLSSADGYSAPAPSLGFGRHTAAAAATGTGTNSLTPTWVAIESFTRSIRDALVSPRGMMRSGSSSGGGLYQQGIPQSQSSEELEMSSLLMMSGSSSSSAVRQR